MKSTINTVKLIVSSFILIIWGTMVVVMMGEPTFNGEPATPAPEWVGWAIVVFILFTPFIVMGLLDSDKRK